MGSLGKKSQRCHNRDGHPRTAVLTCVRELGIEAYYQKHGYETLHTGLVLIGMWDARQECTMVYMEKEIIKNPIFNISMEFWHLEFSLVQTVSGMEWRKLIFANHT